MTTHLLINSIHRVNPTITTPSSFQVKLKEPIKNCHSFSLSSLHLPNVFYNISSRDTLIEIGEASFNIPAGNYNLNELMYTVQEGLKVNYPTITVEYNDILSKVVITNNVNFEIKFNKVLARRLGFLNKNYIGQAVYYSDFPPLIYDLNIYIIIDGGESIKTTNINLLNCSFNIINNRNKGEYITFDSRTQYLADVINNNPIQTILNVKVLDEDALPLESLGDWEMMIRFNH